jgi:hypothetical protein
MKRREKQQVRSCINNRGQMSFKKKTKMAACSQHQCRERGNSAGAMPSIEFSALLPFGLYTKTRHHSGNLFLNKRPRTSLPMLYKRFETPTYTHKYGRSKRS